MAKGRTPTVGALGDAGVVSSNRLPIATICNAARHKKQRALHAVATHPAGEFFISIEHDIHQQVNTSSKRSTTESRLNTGRLLKTACF